jgi:transcription initiation factor TFIIIB Brf1 subunit/transcription initiation factor TFIIB
MVGKDPMGLAATVLYIASQVREIEARVKNTLQILLEYLR